MEMRVYVPWAYFKSDHGCTQLHTLGATGSKYMYWFSDSHQVVPFKRRDQSIGGRGNPFPIVTGRRDNPLPHRTVHIPSFPDDAPWQAPPFKEFFFRPEVASLLTEKPLVVIQNKYHSEWGGPPVNFFSTETLSEMLDYLVPKYTVMYKRHTAAKLGDHSKLFDLGEKSHIREHYPSVIFYEDLQEGLDDPEDQNLLQFGLMALSDRFLTVQGGTAVASSYFGGSTLILVKKGAELVDGDYNYFHRFSNSSVVWMTHDAKFIEKMKQMM